MVKKVQNTRKSLKNDCVTSLRKHDVCEHPVGKAEFFHINLRASNHVL